MKYTKLIYCVTISLLWVDQAIAQGSSAKQGEVARDGFNLQYKIEGQGIPTLVVGSSMYYPRTFSKNLRDHLKLVFMDHRGFVPPPGPTDSSDFSMDKLVDDIDAVREALNLDRVIIIGHSGHSYMALEYAKKYPDRVSQVVMIGIAPDLNTARAEKIARYWEESVDPQRKLVMTENLKRLPDAELAQLSADQAFVKAYVRDAPRIWYNPLFDASYLWEGVYVNMDMMGFVWGRLFRDIDITKGLENFEIPVFLALGRYDYLVAPPSSWDPIRPKFDDLTVRVFEKSGHTPQLEQPQLFDSQLLKWLEQKKD